MVFYVHSSKLTASISFVTPLNGLHRSLELRDNLTIITFRPAVPTFYMAVNLFGHNPFRKNSFEIERFVFLRVPY